MSSKADDFDVRFRDAGPAGHGRPQADGGFRGNAADVDYDLGYDAPGWDTQGFRRPEAGYVDSHESGRASGRRHGGGVGTAVRPDEGRAAEGRAAKGRTARGHRDPSHSRSASPPVAGPPSAGPLSVAPPTGGPVGTEETSQLGWDSEATGLWTPEAPVRGRRAAGGGPGGPARHEILLPYCWR